MTSDARHGYSMAFIREVKAANQEKIAVRFARLCITQNIPVSEVARRFGVSRTAVYSWFRGRFAPNEKAAAEMQKMLDAHAEGA